MDTERSLASNETDRGVAGLDLFAAGLSVLCIAHCLALPLLLSLLALSIPFAEDEMVHSVLVILAAPATLWVIYKSRKRNKPRAFVWMASVGLALLAAGAFVEALEAFEVPITVIGALLLGTAHLRHWIGLRSVAQTLEITGHQSESAR